MQLQNEGDVMLQAHKILETAPLPPQPINTFMFCEKCGCPAMVTSIWINKIGEHTYNLCCGHVVKVKVDFESYEVVTNEVSKI